ncbi:MAG: helix-turn-helix domain-containing protein [Methanoregula sp.]|jgi:predicted ArsR family transcriptional regulator|uniref:ArsR/SmtB family transcription factor n=1 Tax=Methanoregula sp. TaxID=2052170 RepID=UPI0025D8313D|nr:helix-turn-helix domain-containing protein [Methanoregula sp.]MCK9631859.1 helix-turn-helix domain-containing protein [Methanoregula sp.]
MTDNVLVLEPGDEQAQKIGKAMGSPTAGDILQLLADGPKSLTDISDRLSLPMNTAKYHVENLLGAGIISVEDTKYSVKGREVKLYSLTNQLLIVAPRRSDIRSMLLKYASLFGIVAVASLAISSILPLAATWGKTNEVFATQEAVPAIAPAVHDYAGASREAGNVVLKSSLDGIAAAPAPAFDPAIAFFFGGLLVIIILLCYEAWLWKKR